MTESAHVDLNLQNTESSDLKSGDSSSLAKILKFKSKRLAAQKTYDGLLPTAGRHGKNSETEFSFLKSAVGFGSDWSRLEFGLAELGLRDLRVSKPLIDEIGRPCLSVGASTYDDDFIHFSCLLKPGLSEEAKILYESGLSLQQVACRLKVSKVFIRSTLIDAGVSIRPSIHTPEGKLARKSGHMPGAAPYGFVYSRGKLVVHPKEFEVLQMIVEKYQKGDGSSTIARFLNSLKIRSKRNKKWEHSAVAKLIKFYNSHPELIERALRTVSKDLADE